MAGLDFPWPFSDPPVRAWERHGVLCAVRRVDDEPETVNGYVRLPVDHAWVGLAEHEIPAAVHGGITYLGPDGWIGFDTLHAGDPGLTPDSTADPVTTWTRQAVVAETERLAEQAAASCRSGSGSRYAEGSCDVHR